MIVYLNGNYIPKEQAVISPDDRGFLFSDGVYEVICSYSGRLFKAEEHLERLNRSLREIRLEEQKIEKILEVASKLIVKNGLKDIDAKVYIQVTRGAAVREHAFPKESTAPTIYAYCAPFNVNSDKMENGVKVILVPDIRWARCDIKTIALLPNILAAQKAVESGAEDAVFVRDSALTEGTHSNFCAIINGCLYTYPESPYILAGITREVTLNLCRSQDILVKQFPILVNNLNLIEECMILGSTKEVMPVVQIDDMIIGDGKPGPITRKLQTAFKQEKAKIQ